jgi:hypothetical protein
LAGVQANDNYWSRPVNVINGAAGSVPTAKPLLSVDRFVQRRGTFPLTAPGVSGLNPVSLREVSDGTSNTLAVAEYHTKSVMTGSRAPAWGDWRVYTFLSDGTDPDKTNQHPYTFGLADFYECSTTAQNTSDKLVLCERAVASLHSGGLNQCGALDGSVTSLSADVDPLVWSGSVTIGGAETGISFKQ